MVNLQQLLDLLFLVEGVCCCITLVKGSKYYGVVGQSLEFFLEVRLPFASSLVVVFDTQPIELEQLSDETLIYILSRVELEFGFQ